jgi:hypothetical protein
VAGRGLYLWFRYDIVRVWLEAPERLLTARCRYYRWRQSPTSVGVLTAVAERLRD